MKTVREVCELISSVIVDNPVCVETGSTYCDAEDNLIHTTTNNIVDIICAPKGGKLYSFDVDREHQEIARRLCPDDKTAEFILGDSVCKLEEWALKGNKVDLLWLDSKEFDPPHMVNEYNAVRHLLSEKHFVLVDDIHNGNSVKWVEMVPILKETGYKYFEIPTPTGLFFSYIGYSIKL